ncbi:MAG TPA: lysoplasmalogenase [Acidimicrobiales bacterium]|nr:lysoplasmalogenase [Acidimicrobiales bacterium]
MPGSDLTAQGALLLCAAGVSAVIDWWAVAKSAEKIERIFKPATLALLIGTAAVLHPLDHRVRIWLIVGLILGLMGDVFLMGPRENFVGGLASFLAGHLAYIVAFSLEWTSSKLFVIGLAIAAAGLATVGRSIVKSVSISEPRLVLPVVAYTTAISFMVATGFATGSRWALLGSLVFVLSDGMLAFNRFVKPFPNARLFVIVSYHLGQAGIVLSLIH